MTTYTARIMTAIEGTVIELVRFHRQLHPSDLNYWLDGRTRNSWVEIPLKDSQTITPRWRPPVGTKTNKMKLQPEELAGLTQ
jgi:hypothetical protein